MSFKQALLASVFTLGLTTQGHAADVTADQAKAVADQLRAFLTNILTDRVTIPADLMTVTPAGEAYTIVVQSDTGIVQRSDEAGKPTTAWMTATVRPADGTKWHIDSLKFPASYRLSQDTVSMLTTMMPPLSGPTGGPPKGPTGGPGKDPTLEWRIRSQTATGDYDTALATDSHLNLRMEGMVYEARNLGPGMDSRTSVDKMEAQYIIHPTGSGGVDYRTDGTLDGYTVVSNNPTLGDMTIKARHAVVHMETGAVMNAQVADIIRTMIRLGMDAAAAEAKGPDTKAAQDKAGRAALRTVIGMLKGIMTGAKIDEALEGIDVKTGNGSAQIEKVGMSFGGQAPGDTLKAFMELSLGGLKVAGMPPEMVDFVPRSVVLRPTVSNIDVKTLTQIANDAAAEDADEDAIKGQLLTLFTGGGVKVGFEHLDADLGYASLTGTGEATIVGPSAVQGTADIVVKGFDALLAHAAKMPNPAQAMAVLAMAKGFGKSDGDRTVWHIAVSPDNKVLVNGVDVLGGGK